MHKDKIKELLGEATAGLLTEDTYLALGTAIEQLVESRVSVAVNAKLAEQDAQYTAKVKTLLEAIDKDHCTKLLVLKKGMDEKYTKQLKAVVSKYESMINEQAKVFVESTNENISNFLDVYLKKEGLVEQIEEAVNNKKAINILKELRKTLSVDAASQNDVIREGVMAGKAELDKALADVKVLTEKVNTLTKEKARTDRTLLIESKVRDLPITKQNYLRNAFENKDTAYIKENFDYVSKLYDKNEDSVIETLRESTETVTEELDQSLVVESKEDTTLMDEYLSLLNS